MWGRSFIAHELPAFVEVRIPWRGLRSCGDKASGLLNANERSALSESPGGD